MTRCEFCGETGHDWPVHEEARADVRAWQREEFVARESDEWMLTTETEW